MLEIYRTKSNKLSGSDFYEVHTQALMIYRKIKQRSKRRPYVRSLYFKKQKIFLELFWTHLFQKQNWRDRVRRLRYFPCAIELIQKTTYAPVIKNNPNKPVEVLFRFYGMTAE